MLKHLIVIACIAVGACGANPRNFKITAENKDNFVESIRDQKGLTVGDMGLLMGAQLRNAAAAAMGGSPPTFVGKTIGQIIDEERAFQAQQKIKDADTAKLAAEAKAKEDARVAELRKAVTLTVFDKKFIPSNPMGGRYSDSITVRFAYENTSGRDIRAFRGLVQFTDLFGKPFYSTSLTIPDPIQAGAKGTWDGSVDFNQFKADHQALRDTDMQNMKTVWLPATIMFADGTTIGEPAQ